MSRAGIGRKPLLHLADLGAEYELAVIEHLLNPLVDRRADRPQLRLQIDELNGHGLDVPLTTIAQD
jgi:hypothetical protein